MTQRNPTLHNQASQAVLRWVLDGKSGERDLDGGELIIGRSRSCDLVLMAPSVSRKHACIYQSKGQFHIKDLESSFGTRVNGIRLEAYRARALRPGDLLELGLLKVQFQDAGGPSVIEEPVSGTMEVAFSRVQFLEELDRFQTGVYGHIDHYLADPEMANSLKSGFDQELREFRVYLESRFRQHEMLRNISQQIFRIHNADQMLTQALRMSARVLGADRGLVFLATDGEHPQTRARHRFNPQEEGTATEMPLILNMVQHCARSGDMLFVEDLLSDREFGDGQTGSIRAAVCVPLNQGSDRAGVIYMDSVASPGLFGKHQAEFLDALSGLTTQALRNAQVFARAVTNPTTGLFLYRHFLDRIAEEIQHARERRRPLALINLEIDDFSGLAERVGKAGALEVATEVARLIAGKTRYSDTGSHHRDGIFYILLPDTDLGGAGIFAERLRQSASNHPAGPEGQSSRITICQGISAFQPGTENDARTFMGQAATALARAKSEGQNRVHIAGVLAES